MTLFHRASVAFAFGFAGALAFPPTDFVPVLAVSFPALIALLRGTPDARAAFVTGWSFAFGYFLLGLYWIAAAMFVDIRAFWWGVPLAAAGLPAFFAIYYGIAAAIARRIGLQGIAGILLFALLWFLADYVRGHLFTGFPWNLEGYAWSGFLPMLQIVGVTGIYGLTLVTLVVACLPAALLGTRCAKQREIFPLPFLREGLGVGQDVGHSSCSWKHHEGKQTVSPPPAPPASGRGMLRASAPLLLGLMTLLAMGIWGNARLAEAPRTMTDVRVRVVQPNVKQAHKWDPVAREAGFQQLLAMTGAPASKPPAMIVWPETASTFYLEEDPAHRRAIASRLEEGSEVITGVIRRRLGLDGKLHYANSLVAIDRMGDITAAYDKFHLVPFGEYIPFRSILPIRTLANLGVDFTPGEGLQTLRLDHQPSFSPLICYEAIFPGEVARHDDRPTFLLNVTNDGWYGRTAGPYQHFAIARARAIEEGLPLVRSANTGISGVIDPYGRMVVELGLSKTGFADADLPKPIAPTIFSRYGEIPLWVLFGVLSAVGVAARFVRR